MNTLEMSVYSAQALTKIYEAGFPMYCYNLNHPLFMGLALSSWQNPQSKNIMSTLAIMKKLNKLTIVFLFVASLKCIIHLMNSRLIY